MTWAYNCSLCWMILSIWGVIQLSLMGLFYFMEVSTLLEDVEPDHDEIFDNMTHFLKTIRRNFKDTAVSCWAAAFIYGIIFCISWTGLHWASKKKRREAALKDDDEFFCNPPPPKVGKKLLVTGL